MAERLMIKLLASLGQPRDDWQVTSAGTWAVDGIPPDETLVAVMQEFDIDLRDHRSRMIDESVIEEQDLVLVMEFHHQEALQFEFPQCRQKIFLLSQMIGQQFEISDPFSRPINAYRRVAKEIEALLADGYEQIAQLSRSGRM